MEALGLGLFMVSACAFGALPGHPASPLKQALPDPFTRRALGGAAMGLTALAIFHSPFGKRSGAHLNPSVTLTFLRLGKIAPAGWGRRKGGKCPGTRQLYQTMLSALKPEPPFRIRMVIGFSSFSRVTESEKENDPQTFNHCCIVRASRLRPAA
ncbi:MAG: hypothetical protein SFV51_01780 [Bryobacteraceae bacterium]|nr:hypothetical protein [Bryobacteraceae bacterium]